MKTRTESFSLIEVLIFTAVISLFLVIAAAVVTTTVRVTRINQSKIKATHYAEELREWLQSEREIDWNGEVYKGVGFPIVGFTQQVTQPLKDFCFNEFPVNEWPLSPGASDCGFDMNGYRRIATFSASVVDAYVNQVGIDISVSWLDGANIYSFL